MNHKTYYPINLDLAGKKCLIVGGGDVAERKARSLVSAGAKVTVVSPELSRKMSRLVGSRKVVCKKRDFRKSDLKGFFLVIAATDNPAVNILVARLASARNMLVNVVDIPELCNFIVPSVFRQGPLVIGISTGGASPMAAQEIKKRIEAGLGKRYGAFITLLGRTRRDVKNRYATMAERKAVYRKIIASPVLELLEKNKVREAKETLRLIVKKG